MNQDPMNPGMQNPVQPQMPVEPMMNPTQSFNPAAAATPDLGMPASPEMAAPQAPITGNPAPAIPEAPAGIPEMPTIDPALLQEAIADVPDGATPAPEQPAAVSVEGPAPDESPFATAAPTMDTNPTPEQPTTPAEGEPQKTTPSVAFNDPASQPDGATAHRIKKPSFLDGKKINPVVAIVAGSAIIIVALILVIAFVI